MHSLSKSATACWRLRAGAHLQARKLGLLNFTAAAGLAPADALPLYLAGAADPGEAVARRAEELLRKRRAARPSADAHSVPRHALRWLALLADALSVMVPLPRRDAGPGMRSLCSQGCCWRKCLFVDDNGLAEQPRRCSPKRYLRHISSGALR